MKLTSIAIEGYGVCCNLRLGTFNNGLNVVFGETGSGKSTIRNFVRGVMFGFEPASTRGQNTDQDRAHGQIDISHGNLDYQLVRDIRLGENFSLRSMNSVGAPNIHSIGQLTGNLDLSLYDVVFNVEFHDTRKNSTNLATQLHTRLGVPLGSTSNRDEFSFQRWQRETVELSTQLSGIQRRIDSLTVEKRGLDDQIELSKSSRNEQLVSLERQLSDISAQIATIDLLPTENGISNIKSEIAKLLELIANSEIHYVPTPTVTPSVSQRYVTLYERLDEIENQIRRWRRVQSDIQTQRVRLRDEMLAWNELTLESNEHPYHNARRLLVQLESKVDQVESHSRSWASTLKINSESTQGKFDDVCTLMRNDIRELCHELGHQYKHIRQKAAAAELKQLRRCYNEMGENTERLVQRRESVIVEIRRVDPAGAEAIERANPQFCHCALHEGYFEARRRVVGSVSETVQPFEPNYAVGRPDFSSQRNRLAELEDQLSQDHTTLGRLKSQRLDLKTRHADYACQRERLLAQLDQSDLLAKIENINVEILRSTDQYNELKRSIGSREFVETANPILEKAARYLSQMSLGDLCQTWLGDRAGEIVAMDRFNNTVRFDSLSRGQQDLVYLSLCLAAGDSLTQQGVTSPMLLDDVFANLDPQRVTSTFNVLCECGRIGQQILAFAKTNELDRPSSSTLVTVFDLPPTVVPAPYSTPERQPYFPVREPHWEADLERENGFFKSYRDLVPTFSEFDAPVSYPLTKYPRVGPREAVSPAMFDETAIGGPMFQPEIRLQTAKAFTELTLLGNEGIVDASDLGHLNRHAINTIAELLDLDGDNLSDDLIQVGISNRKFDRWQALYWMLICVPGMTTTEAQVLYACGISQPEQLDTTNSRQLLERVQSYLATIDGRRFRSQREFSSDSINRWYRALDTTRSHWSRGNGDSLNWRKNRSRTPKLKAFDDNQPAATERRREKTIPAPSPRVRSDRSRRASRVPPMTTPMVQSFTERQRSARPVTAFKSQVDQPVSNDVVPEATNNRNLKFHLDLDDLLEAAPSIGNRTAERFEAIGIITIKDFLKQTAESMATGIDYKRISANVIRQWQHQTRLVCRVPNLRGHDARLLVACGITEPEDISIMQPNKLMDIIGPFSETKEGLRIIRSGKKPDLDEITDWIDWAGHTRSIQAA